MVEFKAAINSVMHKSMVEYITLQLLVGYNAAFNVKIENRC